MLKHIYPILILSLYLTTHVLGSEWSADLRILNDDADKLHHDIRMSHKPIPPEEIKNNLDFLRAVGEYHKPNIDPKFYVHPITFQEFFEATTAEIKGERFLSFATTCKQMYEEMREFEYKLALFLLFDKVTEKEKDYLRLRKERRDKEEGKEDSFPEDSKKCLEKFNALFGMKPPIPGESEEEDQKY